MIWYDGAQISCLYSSFGCFVRIFLTTYQPLSARFRFLKLRLLFKCGFYSSAASIQVRLLFKCGLYATMMLKNRAYIQAQACIQMRLSYTSLRYLGGMMSKDVDVAVPLSRMLVQQYLSQTLVMPCCRTNFHSTSKYYFQGQANYILKEYIIHPYS